MPSETCTIFENDERGYFRWLARHSNGYVLNTTRGHSAQMMVLHRAVCASIKVYRGSARPGGFTERETIKVCAAEIESLAAWAQEHGREDGNFSGECGLCRPRQRRMWAAVSMYTLHAAIRMVLEESGGALSDDGDCGGGQPAEPVPAAGPRAGAGGADQRAGEEVSAPV